MVVIILCGISKSSVFGRQSEMRAAVETVAEKISDQGRTGEIILKGGKP